MYQASGAAGLGTLPAEGRNPTMLLKLPGFRSEPPWSLPSAIGSMPLARAAPAPPLLPTAAGLRQIVGVASWAKECVEGV